jgi:hypothetical protein
MAWTTISYPFGSTLTSSKMTQNQDNFTALAQGLSGSPAVLAEALSQWPFNNGNGDGNLGSAIYSSNTNLAKGIYAYDDLTINAGITLGCSDASGGFLILLVKGLATIPGILNLDGKGAAGGAAVGANVVGNVGTAGALGGGGAAGGGGGANNGGSGGAGISFSTYTTSGGVGDAGAGNNGSVANTTAVATIVNRPASDFFETFGGGGGGSGGTGAGGSGGAGGDGGGTIILIADEIDFSGTATADGANGSNGASFGGGGGGGAGGAVIMACRIFIANIGSTTVTGGSGGTGFSGYGNGGTGGAGLSEQFEG